MKKLLNIYLMFIKLINMYKIFIKLILNRPSEDIPDNKLATKTKTGRD